MTYCPPPRRGGTCALCWASEFRDLGDVSLGGRGTQVFCTEARRTVSVTTISATQGRAHRPIEWCPFNATNPRCRKMVADFVGGPKRECGGIVVPARPRDGSWTDVPYLYTETHCRGCSAIERIGPTHPLNANANDEGPSRRREQHERRALVFGASERRSQRARGCA